MQYNDLIIAVSDRTGYTRREIRDIVRTIVLAIREELGAGRDVQIYGLGKFRNLPAAARTGRHPITGDPVPIPKRRRVRFDPSGVLKTAVEASIRVFEQPNLAAKYGLKEDPDVDGQVCSRDRSEEGEQTPARREGRRFPRL